LTQTSVSRRASFGAALLLLNPVLPIGACTQLTESFGRRGSSTLSRGDRMVRSLQNSGRDTMMAPDALSLMGITNQGRDIPGRQFAEDGRDGRYVVSLINIRNVHDLVFHRRQGEVLVFHQSDTRFVRILSVRYPRTGKPAVITDTALAESDFQQQIAFWTERQPGR